MACSFSWDLRIPCSVRSFLWRQSSALNAPALHLHCTCLSTEPSMPASDHALRGSETCGRPSVPAGMPSAAHVAMSAVAVGKPPLMPPQSTNRHPGSPCAPGHNKHSGHFTQAVAIHSCSLLCFHLVLSLHTLLHLVSLHPELPLEYGGCDFCCGYIINGQEITQHRLQLWSPRRDGTCAVLAVRAMVAGA